MGFSVRGRRVLLTGASSGIGWSLAHALAAEGALLAVAARRVERLEALADAIAARGGARPLVVPADLSRRGEAAKLAERAVARLGGVDVLVNNAGVGVGGTQWAVGDDDAAREVFEVNLWSPLALVAALVPTMRARGQGAVVNVTSVSQSMQVGGLGHYGASKAGLAAATEALRLELAGSGVRVLEVVPGPTQTAIQAESRLLPGFEGLVGRGPMGDPDELAGLVVRALARGRSILVYPRSLRGAYELPGVARVFVRWWTGRAGDLDRDDPRVVRSGSGGDDLARAAREEWERTQGGGS